MTLFFIKIALKTFFFEEFIKTEFLEWGTSHFYWKPFLQKEEMSTELHRLGQNYPSVCMGQPIIIARILENKYRAEIT